MNEGYFLNAFNQSKKNKNCAFRLKKVIAVKTFPVTQKCITNQQVSGIVSDGHY